MQDPGDKGDPRSLQTPVNFPSASGSGDHEDLRCSFRRRQLHITAALIIASHPDAIEFGDIAGCHDFLRRSDPVHRPAVHTQDSIGDLLRQFQLMQGQDHRKFSLPAQLLQDR